MALPPQEGFWRVFAGINFLPITGTDKAVLGCLVDCANSKTGLCYPGQETIDRSIDKDIRVVKRSIANLLKTPYLKCQRRPCTSNLYELGWEPILEAFDAYKERRANKKGLDAGDRNVTTEVTDPSPRTVSDTYRNKKKNYKKKKKRNSLRASPRSGDGVSSSLYPPAGEVANVGGMLARFERAFKHDPSSIEDLRAWQDWLEYEGSEVDGYSDDPNAQRANRLAVELSYYLDAAEET